MTLRDRLIWKENKANMFSMKTAYQVALRLHHPQTGEHSQAKLDRKMWKRIWSVNVPPKALVRGRIQKTSSSVSSFFLLTRQTMGRLLGKEFELWAMIAWALWNARNRIHF
ncbi:hypothetical protein SO802_025808 [Lithocarpus litseifolius]|uniref:Uncharacterized protein n=1 Tax=Lithocarpus litseifolius TaxID=425828 RepID=A0AAW2BZF0_9ROSI